MMSTLLESTQKTETARQSSTFHIKMAYMCAAFLALSLVGCYLTSVRIQDAPESIIFLTVCLAMICPLPIYWHGKGRDDMRDAAMTIPWFLLLVVILPIPVDVFARLGFPLQDFRLGRIDHIFGVHIPGITAWASYSLLGKLANRCYPLLIPLGAISFLLPALTGRVKYAQRFLLSNLAAFIIGLPLFSLVPAIGPWYSYNTTPSAAQSLCQSGLLRLRNPDPYVGSASGVVCFPSFHVIWAILCAAALWTYKPLRVPVTILCGLIILSTMTTGWHYFSDVIAGVAVAILSMKVSSLLTQDSRLVGDFDSASSTAEIH
jgi:membrane-associated phospholipid phosphatase